MSVAWKWRIRYPSTSGTVITGGFSMRPWRRRLHVEGKGRKLANGARESFALRTDRFRRFNLRVTETEFQALETFIAWAHANWGTSFDFDQGSKTGATGTYYACYLETPKPGEDFTDAPSEYPGYVEVSLELQKVDGTAWAEIFY